MSEYRTMEERFWAKVDKSGDCWMWLASTGTVGYGQFGVSIKGKYRMHQAHRVSWMISNGEIPNGLVIMHSCDVKTCVNPGHLRAATQADNVADMISKGREGHLNGDKHPNARLSESQVFEIYDNNIESHVVLGKKYGVCAKQISAIRLGEKWKDVLRLSGRQPRQCADYSRKLKEDEILNIFDDKSSTNVELSNFYGVGSTIISNIRNGKKWVNLLQQHGRIKEAA